MNEVTEQQDPLVFTRRIIENGGKFNITEFIVLEGTPPPDFPRFRGSVQGPIGVKGNGELVIGVKDFSIDADTATEAFQMLPDLLQEAIDWLNHNARRLVAEAIEADKPKPRIAVASKIPQFDNGELRMQFPELQSRAFKQRQRRSR